ncbi:hypothetical protein GPJ56_000996 [Histomonas meleagridis]|uniref:uncharacterized protein n=1 Tax=Histomonas meleagridis TaxID=135588 RepID=UPI00355A47F0|nr:hypothetical protein GPJ56_000996 [Histomonas meleagridis]KAH0803833.1 hypothetical protein GO595_002663 [Histomonas meleagridis]
MNVKIKITGFSSDESDNEKSDSPESSETPTFTKADTSLPLSQQAKENLINFKKYLEKNPPDPSSDYDHVYQTMSHAFSDWTNNVTTLQSEISELSVKRNEYEEKINEKEKEKSQLEKQLSELSIEKKKKTRELEEKKSDILKLEDQKNQNFKLKTQIENLTTQFNELLEKLQARKDVYEKEKEKTTQIQNHCDDVEKKVHEKEDSVQSDIEKDDAELKELMNQAKKTEIIPEIETKQTNKKQPTGPQEVETYVINDNVKVSQEEINGLKYMISEIQRENEEITIERDSKMMDVDCILQENLGLKQIIREMTE